MFKHDSKHHEMHKMHHGFHIAEDLKKAVKWYFAHAAVNYYVWSPKPMSQD